MQPVISTQTLQRMKPMQPKQRCSQYDQWNKCIQCNQDHQWTQCDKLRALWSWQWTTTLLTITAHGYGCVLNSIICLLFASIQMAANGCAGFQGLEHNEGTWWNVKQQGAWREKCLRRWSPRVQIAFEACEMWAEPRRVSVVPWIPWETLKRLWGEVWTDRGEICTATWGYNSLAREW